jgi:hypothetical protein
MKYLSDYVKDAHSALFDETGTIFAFSTEQFEKAKDPNIPNKDYIQCGNGMIVPRANVNSLFDGLAAIQKAGIKLDIAENGKKGIIERELINRECLYTNCIDDCVDALKDYGISKNKILAVFNEIRTNEDISEYF